MNYFISIWILLLISSCNSGELTKVFNCNTIKIYNLDSTDDFKKIFTVKFPKHWKTKLYYDDVISSVYSADTTLNLTKSVLIDVSFIANTASIDDNFIIKVKNDNTTMQLKEVQSKKIKFKKNNAYYNLAKGKKGKFDYHVLNLFSKGTMGFLYVKTEIYGDSLVNERLCTAIRLIEKIQYK